MARMKKLALSVMNIKIHPHSPQLYIDLFECLKSNNNKMIGKIRGNDYAIIGWMHSVDSTNPTLGLYGEFYKYLNIDPSQPWLDISKVEKIDVDKEHPMPVPDNLKPNLRSITFIFDPEHHRLLYDTHNISPNGAKKVLDALFSYDEIKKRFGAVDVEIEKSLEGIEQILKIPKKTKIEINITLPNPDDLSGLEKDVMNRLRDANIRKQVLTQSTNHEDGIKPDDRTLALINLSRSNGKTTVTGKDKDGEKIIESTENHPYYESVEFDPDKQNAREAMWSEKSRIIMRIVQNKNV